MTRCEKVEGFLLPCTSRIAAACRLRSLAALTKNGQSGRQLFLIEPQPEVEPLEKVDDSAVQRLHAAILLEEMYVPYVQWTRPILRVGVGEVHEDAKNVYSLRDAHSGLALNLNPRHNLAQVRRCVGNHDLYVLSRKTAGAEEVETSEQLPQGTIDLAGLGAEVDTKRMRQRGGRLHAHELDEPDNEAQGEVWSMAATRTFVVELLVGDLRRRYENLVIGKRLRAGVAAI